MANMVAKEEAVLGGLITALAILFGAAAVYYIYERSKQYRCPVCGGTIFEGQNPCPHCRSLLTWKKKGA